MYDGASARIPFAGLGVNYVALTTKFQIMA